MPQLSGLSSTATSATLTIGAVDTASVYLVQQKKNGVAVGSPVQETSAGTPTYSIAAADADVWTFEVSAQNINGATSSAAVTPGKVVGVPLQPSITSATGGVGQITLVYRCVGCWAWSVVRVWCVVCGVWCVVHDACVCANMGCTVQGAGQRSAAQSACRGPLPRHSTTASAHACAAKHAQT